MIVKVLWLSLLLTGTYAQSCGSESIDQSATGANDHIEFFFTSSTPYNISIQDLSSYFDVTDPSGSCSTVTYSILDENGGAYTGSKFSIDSTQLTIDRSSAFAQEKIYLRGTMPGGATADVYMNLGAVNSGCQYSQSGGTSHSETINPTAEHTIKWSSFSCQFDSDNTAQTDCRTDLAIMYADSQGQTALTDFDWNDEIISAGQIPAGYSATIYYAVGLLGDPFNYATLVASSTICNYTYYSCGKETLALANSGTETLSLTQGSTGDTQVYDPNTVAGYFQLTHTDNQSYVDCSLDTYALQDANGNALSDTTVVTYSAATGITVQLENTQTNYVFKLQATTKGGVTLQKDFDLTVSSSSNCGSEQIATGSSYQSGYQWGMFASQGQKIDFGESLSSGMFDVTNAASGCETLTYSLYQTDGSTIWSDSKIYISSSTNRIEIDIDAAFGDKQLIMQATTPGGASATVTLNIIVLNSGCSYSLAQTTADFYMDPTTSNSIDPASSPCGWATSNSASTDCPLSYLMLFANDQGSQNGVQQIGPYSSMSMPANQQTAGDKLIQYTTVGFPAQLPAYLVKSPVCTETFYFCGKETVAPAANSAIVIKQGSSSGVDYVYSHADLDALFTVDTSAADAYSGCGINTYELVQSDGITQYTDTTYVSYAATADANNNIAQGVSWKLDLAVANFADVHIKVTTVGGESTTRQFDFTVIGCGSETIAQNSVGQDMPIFYGMFADSGKLTTFTSARMSSYWDISNSADVVCEDLTYSLSDYDTGSTDYTDSKITINTDNVLEIDIDTAFAEKKFRLHGDTPSGQRGWTTMKFIVTNPGCTYTLGSKTSQDHYIDYTADYTIDPATLDCQWTSSNSADTDCPIKYNLFYSDTNGNSGDLKSYAEMSAQTITGGSAPAGYLLTDYRAVGIPGYLPNKEHLVRGGICTENYYFCGKETVSLANSGSEVVQKAQDTSSGSATVYTIDENTMASYFTIDTSASDAYSGCGVQKYELVQSDETTAYTDTTYVSYTAGTGLSFKIASETAQQQEIYLKMTTIGQISKVKQFSFSVFGCGSESIELNNVGTAHVEAIYATGNANDVQVITGGDIDSNHFKVTDSTGSCGTITKTLQDSSGNAWTHSKISLDGQGNLEIKKETAFAAETFYINGCTPGGSCIQMEFTIMVVNQGCSYSHSGSNTALAYADPAADTVYDFTQNECKYTSTNTADTDCPLYRLYYKDATGAEYEGVAFKHSVTSNIPATSMNAGDFPGTLYYKVGLPGDPFNKVALSVASEVCTMSMHLCGLETITEQNSGDQALTYSKSDNSGNKETVALSTFETWYKVDVSAFTAGTGRDWSGCKANSYQLLQSDGGSAYTDDSKAEFDSSANELKIVTDTVVTHNIWLQATTVGGKKFSKKIEVKVEQSCGVLTWSYTSTPAMTNTLTVGTKSYKIYEKVVNIGASTSTATASISNDVTFTNNLIQYCPVATWTIKSSLTATTSLSSGQASDAATQSFQTNAPKIIDYFYSVSTAANSATDTINYKIAVCGLEKVAVADASQLKITKYYNEFKKDYNNLKYYSEAIYSTWFSLNTATLVNDGLVSNAVEANMFKNCPINDFMLCADEPCEKLHSANSLFYFEYQTKAKVTSDGSLQADGKEPAATRRLATAPKIPYTDPSFNITKVSVRDTEAKYSRIVMKVDSVYSQTAYLAAVTTGYAKGVRAITFENKCGLEYIYPQKTAYDYQLQINNGQYTVQATEYQSWFKNSFTLACPIVKYEIRSFSAAVTVDEKLADGTYLKFTKEYLAAQSVTDPKIPSVAASAQQATDSQGGTSKYSFCHNSLTDEGVACTSTNLGGKRLDEFDFPEDDIMRRVEVLSTGQLQINTDGQTLNEDSSNTYQVDLVAISEGGAEAFAHLNIEFIAKRVAANNPPTFASNPSALTINKVDDFTVQTYTSPQASDLDGESITIEVSGNIYSFITIETSDTNFVITVDHSQITQDLDGKTFSLSVELSDTKDTTSYTVSGQINWQVIEPEPEPEPEVIEEDVVEVEEEQQVELKEGEVEIGAETAEWQEVASPEVMNQLFAGVKVPPPRKPSNGNEEEEEEEEVFKPVKINSETNSVSRDGAFAMRFNQRMKVPDFIDNGQSSNANSSRMLAKDDKPAGKITKIPLSQLDVERDICSVRFILASEVDPKDIKYFLVIKRWDETGVDIYVNFTDPMLVSRGEDRDLVEVSIKRPQLFISQESGQMIDTSDLVFYQTIPRQLPKGVSEQSLKEDAEDIAAVLNSMAYIQIVLQFMLKGIMADLMVTFYCLQLCCFFTIYKVQIPGNSEIYIDEFRKLIDMDAVKPDNVLKQFNEDWSVDYFMNLSKERMNSAAESSGLKSSSFVKNMSTFIFIAGGIIGGIIVMALLTTLKSRFQALIKEKLNGTLNKMFFNGQIKGMTVSYLKTTIAFSASVQFMDFSGMSNGELWAALGIPSMICLVYPFVCLFVVLKFRPHLGKARFKKRISNMYEGVALTRNNETVLFYPFYLIRRLLFVGLPLIFWFNTVFQVQVLFTINFIYSIFFFHAQPIADRVKNKMQMYNEGMMIVITYHMFYFTDFADMSRQFTMGYSFVFTLCAILLVNAVKMGHNSFLQSMSARRKLANQKAYEKAYNDWVEFQISSKANRKQDREKKRLEKLERAEKAMNAFQASAMAMNIKADIKKRQALLKKKEEEAAKKQKGAIDQLFSQNSSSLDLFAQKPQKKPKRHNQADMLKISLQKKLDLTKIQEQEGEETNRTAAKLEDIYDQQEAVDTAKNEFDLAFQNMFQGDEDSDSQVELTEEEIEFNKLISSLSFLDRVNYRKNAELIKKYSQMDQKIQEKKKETKLSLKDTIDLLDNINKEFKRILPLEAINLQHKKLIGDVEPQEHSTHEETADEQFDIYLTAIQIEIEQIKDQQDKIERKNAVGKYQHLKKVKKNKPFQKVINLDALDQELTQGMPIEQVDDSKINFDIELPDRLKNKRQNNNQNGNEKEKTTGADDLMIGAAIVGVHSVIPLNDQDLDNMRANQDDENTIRIVDPNEDVEVPEEMSQSKFKHMMAKMKYMGAEGLVFAGILEKEDLPPNPDEELKNENEEEKKEESEDEDDDSDSDEDEDDDGEGGGKKKKKKGVVEEEEEEELPEDY